VLRAHRLKHSRSGDDGGNHPIQTRIQAEKNGSGKTLCKSGFHKWTDDPRKQFDVKQGKLVSVQRCARCAATRTLLR
jgi:hypothetical protein